MPCVGMVFVNPLLAPWCVLDTPKASSEHTLFSLIEPGPAKPNQDILLLMSQKACFSPSSEVHSLPWLDSSSIPVIQHIGARHGENAVFLVKTKSWSTKPLL